MSNAEHVIGNAHWHRRIVDPDKLLGPSHARYGQGLAVVEAAERRGIVLPLPPPTPIEAMREANTYLEEALKDRAE
jgi:hypothetical protein